MGRILDRLTLVLESRLALHSLRRDVADLNRSVDGLKASLASELASRDDAAMAMAGSVAHFANEIEKVKEDLQSMILYECDRRDQVESQCKDLFASVERLAASIDKCCSEVQTLMSLERERAGALRAETSEWKSSIAQFTSETRQAAELLRNLAEKERERRDALELSFAASIAQLTNEGRRLCEDVTEQMKAVCQKRIGS